ncbi:conserved hypothetical protein [Talaromyces stipitatus ATCC 10500]|uniref:DNA-directed RNA polymerase III subunit n=1 Tax=Talaromyces stipitatus (strain ATCC 10500 / CBS 375.48 / QM 6759 / NRRL 1006) TaxID=441959 RepID=B8MR97_TALSN|nr:uncharacterized protein TSTA_054990 [Talaromyces stipitatus ATCC 10500]EED12992.1 conserved hypothetical protein [Talaromyces stipitatus ATCC 10500]
MSFGGGRGARKPLPPGSEFNWQKLPGELPDGAPTPTFPPYDTPKAEPLSKRERAEVDQYRALRDHFQNGPYYAAVNAASTSAKQGTKERAQFDPFHGMPSYSARYQKRKRTVPKIAGREYIVHFFPRELWRVVRPDYKPDRPDTQTTGTRWKRVQAQFEDVGDEDVEEDEQDRKRQKEEGDDEEETQDDDGKDLDDDVEKEGSEEDDELRDDDFSEDDDEMGGDYNAEQYFDAGDDDGDGDGFADGGGGGGDEDFF